MQLSSSRWLSSTGFCQLSNVSYRLQTLLWWPNNLSWSWTFHIWSAIFVVSWNSVLHYYHTTFVEFPPLKLGRDCGEGGKAQTGNREGTMADGKEFWRKDFWDSFWARISLQWTGPAFQSMNSVLAIRWFHQWLSFQTKVMRRLERSGMCLQVNSGLGRDCCPTRWPTTDY